jgi:uncharacterized protein (UPF0264 family)
VNCQLDRPFEDASPGWRITGDDDQCQTGGGSRRGGGGADIIDIKNPNEGSLGAQPPHVITAIVKALPPAIPVSASIGDVPNLPGTVALAGLGAALCGVRFVKVGLLGARTPKEAAGLLEAIQRALAEVTGTVRLVACAYADAALV